MHSDDTDSKIYDEIPDAKLLTKTMEHYLKELKNTPLLSAFAHIYE